MGAYDFEDLKRHLGHKIACVSYADSRVNDTKTTIQPQNIAVECETCNEVLLDYDRPKRGGKK